MSNDPTDLLALARRAVACKGWRWMPGMRYPQITGGEGRRAWVRGAGRVRDDGLYTPGDAFPDLSDPATLGCLLALVREAWASEGTAYTYPASGGWHVIVRGRIIATGDTEAEALVVALEEAP